MNQEQLAVWRGKNIGVIFQFFQLLPTLTIAENIMLPMDFCKTYPSRQRRDRAMMLLAKFGIPERAAIARALANDPPILVADEPTGNLDSQTSEEVMDYFKKLASEGKTIIMVTHERDFNKYFTQTITLKDGLAISENVARKKEE